jgi:hypothetical protein
MDRNEHGKSADGMDRRSLLKGIAGAAAISRDSSPTAGCRSSRIGCRPIRWS